MMIKGFVTLAWRRYLVHVQSICAGYSLLSAAIIVMPRPSTMSRAWTFFLLDQVTILSLLLSLLIYLDINIFQLRPTLLIINKGTIYLNMIKFNILEIAFERYISSPNIHTHEHIYFLAERCH